MWSKNLLKTNLNILNQAEFDVNNVSLLIILVLIFFELLIFTNVGVTIPIVVIHMKNNGSIF